MSSSYAAGINVSEIMSNYAGVIIPKYSLERFIQFDYEDGQGPGYRNELFNS